MGKKLLKILTSLALVGAMSFAFAACGEGNWKSSVTLKTPGAVISNGGFVVETDNYVYFINGEESYTASNNLGSPVKGALMVMAKSDIGTEKQAETVVPKVLSSSDYNAGVYVFGDKIYYATPSTKKDTSGNIANDHLDFCSSNIDGTGYKVYTTVDGNATNYRFVQSGNDVLVVYYDTEDTAIKSYNFTSGKTVTVKESPASYTFLDNASIAASGISVVYTENIHDESVGANLAYNKLFAYSSGDSATEISYSTATDVTIAITLSQNGNIFYSVTQKRNTDNVKYYGVAAKDLAECRTKAVEYKDATLLVNTTLFVDLKTAYAVDGEFVAKYTTEESAARALETKELVAKAGVTTLLFNSGDNMYYINSSSQIARVAMNDADAEEVRVSKDAVVTDWYKPVLAAGRVFCLDASAQGLSYVNAIKIDQAVIEEDTDDDEETDLWYLEKVDFIGKINEADTISIVSLKISALSGDYTQIVFEEGEYTAEDDIIAARAAYEALTKNQKKSITADELNVLENYEKYLEVSKDLKVIVDAYFDSEFVITEANKAEWQAKIDSVNAKIEDYEFTSSQIGMLIQNGMYAKQEMQKEIDALSE